MQCSNPQTKHLPDLYETQRLNLKFLLDLDDGTYYLVLNLATEILQFSVSLLNEIPILKQLREKN